MSGQEIKERLDKNNAQIAKLLHKFVLTDEINKLLKENDELRFLCPHEFDKGICIFCGRGEEDDNG